MNGAAADTPHIRFVGVTKRYGSVAAVRELTLDVRRGEFLTLLGPSGSGKTTALMMLAGFEDPTEGEIWIDGRRVDQVPPNRRGIGMVFQNYALFPHMSVAENLAFPLQVRRVTGAEIERRVRAALEMVRLPHAAGRRPDQLSGGQQQRIAVARALIFQPGLILMDEPLGALDRQLREEMQFEIKDMHARLGITFVYVTHDQTEALTMSDRIAVFESGTIRQLSGPQALYEEPQTRFVASFIGESNQFEGAVENVATDAAIARAADDGLVHCTPVHAMTPGAKVVLSIRPERIRLLAPGEHADNSFEATIRQIVYVGDHIRIGCNAAGIGSLVAKVPSGTDIRLLHEGASVRVGWRRADCLALPS
jgi:putative spermidine/putrescine transport system ATP-binding protein